MDILKIRDWYKTPLGHMARRVIQASLNEMWPTLRGKRVLVVGYGLPFIPLWPKECDVYVAMLGQMGCLPWPETGKNRTSFCWDDQLPFAEDMFDAVFIAHALEFSENDYLFMDEVLRVLKDDGKALFMLPNRTGAWCRSEVTPFSRGKPYSFMQFEKVCRNTGFAVQNMRGCLYAPPLSYSWLLQHAGLLERFGKRFRAPMGGVMLAEVHKDLYAGTVVRTDSNVRLKRFVMRATPS